MNQSIRLLLKAFHPKFLLLTPACFVLGWACASLSQSEYEYWRVALAFIGALCAHVTVNGMNEYLDYRSGLDERTRKTPFSGGSGVLQSRPDLAPWVLALSGVTFGITVMAGLVFVWEAQSALLLAIGLLGLFLVVAYTPWVTKNPFFCLIAPGLGFGILMVGGSAFVISGQIVAATWIGSLITFFVVNNLLLLNQYPDIEADKTVGRAHVPIVYGVKTSTVVYGIFAVSACGLLTYGLVSETFPLWTALGYIPFMGIPLIIRDALRYTEHGERFIVSLGLNVFVALGTPVLIALGFWLDMNSF